MRNVNAYTLYLDIERASCSSLAPHAGGMYGRITNELVAAGGGMSHGPMLEEESIIGYDVEKRKKFMWPAVHIGWTIHHIPGLDTRQDITYIEQAIPSMLHFNVSAAATDDQLLFETLEKMPAGLIKMKVSRHQALIHRSGRIIDLVTINTYLEKNESVKEAVEYRKMIDGRGEQCDINQDLEPNHSRDEFPDDVLKQSYLVDLLRANSKLIDNVNHYQTRMVKLANPLVGTPDQFYFHPLHDCDETTNDGALCAIVAAHVNMGILEVTKDDKHKFAGEGRFGMIYGDQLTELRFHPVKHHIMKSLTRLERKIM